jgi:hypothetical protein
MLNNFFFLEIHVASETMWKNMIKPALVTGGNIIRRIHFACWITKATGSHPEYVILFYVRRQ